MPSSPLTQSQEQTERADWRACKESKEEEDAMVAAIKRDFAAFDIAPDDSDSDSD
jgi:hypothetical protein